MINISNLSKSAPLKNFEDLYKKALNKKQNHIEAVCISSYLQETNEVDARYVNIKSIEGDEFIFYTNYNSPKSLQFKSHNQVALTFFWDAINVQIRIKGTVIMAPKIISDNHFRLRNEKKNALAIASNQSSKIVSYEKFVSIYKKTLSSNNLKKRPDYWGGYVFTPYYFEFWEGHESRLNKREVFDKADGTWRHSFLQP